MAAIWRSFASPFSLIVWMSLDAIVVFAVCAYALVKRVPLVLLFGSIGVGLQVASGNVAGFLVGGILVLWTRRERPWVGALLSVMIATKLLPVAFLGFTVRNRQSWPWLIGGLMGCALLSYIGAGLENHLAYPAVIAGLVPYPASLAAWTGVNWIEYLALAVGIVGGYVLPERMAFLVSLAAFVLAAPGIGLWSPLYVLAVAGPWASSGSVPIAAGSSAATGRPRHWARDAVPRLASPTSVLGANIVPVMDPSAVGTEVSIASSLGGRR